MPPSHTLILASSRHKDEGHSFYVADLSHVNSDEAREINSKAREQPVGSDYISVERGVVQNLENLRRSHERLILCGVRNLSAAQQLQVAGFLTTRLEAWEDLRNQKHGEQRAWTIQSDIIAQWQREAGALLKGEAARAADRTAPAAPPAIFPARPRKTMRRVLFFGACLCCLGFVVTIIGRQVRSWLSTGQPQTQAEQTELEANDATAFLRNPVWQQLAAATGMPARPEGPVFAVWLRQVHQQFAPWHVLPGTASAADMQQALARDDTARQMVQAALQSEAQNAINQWPQIVTQPACDAGRQSLSSMSYALTEWRSSPVKLTTAELAGIVRSISAAVQTYASRSDLHASLHEPCGRLLQQLGHIPAPPSRFNTLLTAADLLRWQAVTSFLFETPQVYEALTSLSDVRNIVIGEKLPADWRPRFELIQAGTESSLVTAAEVRLLTSLGEALKRPNQVRDQPGNAER